MRLLRVDKNEARASLSSNGWETERAADSLLHAESERPKTVITQIKLELDQLNEMNRETRKQIYADLINDPSFEYRDRPELMGHIAGPPGSPYEKGTYHLHIKIPETHPFDPPKIRFLTDIWHPNVSSVTGDVSSNVLMRKWRPEMTINETLIYLQEILASPCLDMPEHVEDEVVAWQFQTDPEMFQATARHWNSTYAMRAGKAANHLKGWMLIP